MPDFPRWAPYLSLWTALLFIPACLIFWFKVGPFSWNGVVACYIPVFIFFIWVLGLTVLAIQAVRREVGHGALCEMIEEACNGTARSAAGLGSARRAMKAAGVLLIERATIRAGVRGGSANPLPLPLGQIFTHLGASLFKYSLQCDRVQRGFGNIGMPRSGHDVLVIQA